MNYLQMFSNISTFPNFFPPSIPHIPQCSEFSPWFSPHLPTFFSNVCFPLISHVFHGLSHVFHGFPTFFPRFPTFSPRFPHVFPGAHGPGLAAWPRPAAQHEVPNVMTFDQHAAEQLAMEAAEAMQEVPPAPRWEPNGKLTWLVVSNIFYFP